MKVTFYELFLDDRYYETIYKKYNEVYKEMKLLRKYMPGKWEMVRVDRKVLRK